MNEVLADVISKHDEEALKYLKDIKWCGIDKHKGFKLEFFFDANPYFKKSMLTKTYHTIDYDDKPIVEKAIGVEIEWYSGKSLTEKLLKPGKGSKNAHPITKRQKVESFFNFFNPPQISADDDDIDEDDFERLRDQMKQDYDIGFAIQKKIIPHAVSWFTGEAAVRGDDFGDLDDGDEDEEDDDDDDDDDDDEEEEEEERQSNKKSSGSPKKRGRALACEGQKGEHPPQCKQHEGQLNVPSTVS